MRSDVSLGSHDSLGQAASRFLPNFVPVLLAWLAIGWLLGVFDTTELLQLRHIWRVPIAMVVAAPLFGVLRALWLGSETVTVVFVLVMGGLGALSMLGWRALLWLVLMRREARHG